MATQSAPTTDDVCAWLEQLFVGCASTERNSLQTCFSSSTYRLPPPLFAGDTDPAGNLPRIIVCAAAHPESAIPLKPSSRILRNDPSLPLPLRLILPRLHTIFINLRCAVPPARVLLDSQSVKPRGRKLFVRDVDSAPEYARLPTPRMEIASAEGAHPYHLLRRQRRPEQREVFEHESSARVAFGRRRHRNRLPVPILRFMPARNRGRIPLLRLLLLRRLVLLLRRRRRCRRPRLRYGSLPDG